MLSKTRLTPLLTLSALLLAAPGCAPKERIQPLFPPVADLTVEPKPVAPPDILTSAQAAAEYDVKLESWGERGWRTVGRLCRWAKGNGMAINCPAPE